MRRTMTKLLRTRRPPHEVFLVRGRTRSAPAQHVLVLIEKIRSEDGVPSTLPRQGGDQPLSCLHKATRWLLTTPLKIGWTVQGAWGGRQPSSTHSHGPAPLLYKDYVHRRLKTTAVPLLGHLWQPLPQVDEGKEDLGTIKGEEVVMRTSLWLIQPLHLQPHFLTFHDSKDLSEELVHAN
jgi:hypothetical protein